MSTKANCNAVTELCAELKCLLTSREVMEGNWGWRASVVGVRGEALQEAALQKKRKLQLKRLANQTLEGN